MIILQTKGLTKTYGNGDTCVTAVKNLDISIKKGEFVSIIGSSGSGKSTLLHMLGGLDTPTSGTVSINDKEIYLLSKEDLTNLSKKKYWLHISEL